MHLTQSVLLPGKTYGSLWTVVHHCGSSRVLQIPNNNSSVVSTPTTSFVSWGSSISIGSISSIVKEADELYDKIEDMLSDYMREPHRHYLHCRVLKWALEEDQSRTFIAVLIINPPATQN